MNLSEELVSRVCNPKRGLTPRPVTTCSQIKVRACSIQCNTNPEWGTFGVMEDHGTHYDIYGRGGFRVLSKTEANKFWSVV